MKKSIRLVAALLMAMVLFQGCNKQGQNSNINDKIKLTISFWEPSTGQELETALMAVGEKYKEIRKNVEFEFISQPVNGYTEWMKAQFAANNPPVIEYNGGGALFDQYKNGLVIDIEDDLNSPNPYANNVIWKDIFFNNRMEASIISEKKHTFGIPISGLGIAYYYNVDLYEKLGLKPPKTWNEFIANCEVIKNDGTNPIAFMAQKKDAVEWLGWYITTGMFGDVFLADKEINVNGDNNIDPREASRAIDMGYYDVSKQGKYQDMYLKYLDMIRIYSQYAQDCTGLDEQGAKEAFLDGKAAHIMSGSWDIKSFLVDCKTPFKISAFPFPKFTKENSPSAGPNMMISNMQPLGITKAANKSPEIRDAAIDFLKFLTAPDNYKTYVEKTYSIPVVKNIDIDPLFKAFQAGERSYVNCFTISGKKSKFTNRDAAISILSGQDVDMKDILQKVQSSNVDFSKEVLANYGLTANNNYGMRDLPKIGGDFIPK